MAPPPSSSSSTRRHSPRASSGTPRPLESCCSLSCSASAPFSDACCGAAKTDGHDVADSPSDGTGSNGGRAQWSGGGDAVPVLVHAADIVPVQGSIPDGAGLLA